MKRVFLKFKDSIEHVRFNLWFLSDPDVRFEMLDGDITVDEKVRKKER